MPGWRGLVLNRSQGICFSAVEKILEFNDVSYLTTAYRHAVQKRTKISLMRLLEAVALQTFFTKPNNSRAGWGSKDIDEALLDRCPVHDRSGPDSFELHEDHGCQ